MGVILVACFTTIAISFMPPRAVRRVFPPMISGVTIFLVRNEPAQFVHSVIPYYSISHALHQQSCGS